MITKLRLIATVTMVCWTYSPSSAQERSLDELRREVVPAKINDADSPLQKLLKERYNTAIEEVKSVDALRSRGLVSLETMAEALQRVAQCGVELAATPAERIKHRELNLAAAQAVERIVREKFESATESLQAYLRAKGLRLDAEIALLRERETAK
jgi:hypothetical protein